MPVDLTLIPDAASRKHPPSLKRWSVVLLIFFLCAGFLTLWLWPADSAARGALFWHCFISAPLVLWVILLVGRWLCYLASEWPAEGWDDERQQDIVNEIRRGQRFLVLDASCVHLPHVVTSGELAQQFIMPRGIVLPAVPDENRNTVVHQASFDDTDQALPERISTRLRALLDDTAVQATLVQHYAARLLNVVIQAAGEHELTEDDLADIQQHISPLLPASARIQFLPAFGLTDIDHWLDTPGLTEALLILSVNVKMQVSDGEAEAAVALFLRSVSAEETGTRSVAHIHRPERSRHGSALYDAAMQALLWGKTTPEETASLWLTGTGTANQAQSLLAGNNLKFPRAEKHAQVTDIDLKSGHTGRTSPWLAIALAAGNTGQSPYPQLIMSIPEKDALPWWLVVHPLSGS